MKQHIWKDEASCRGYDTEIFFEKYEEDISFRPAVDEICRRCPVAKRCFAVGISGREWGVWGGVYIEDGDISREFNKHKTKSDWSETWKSLTMER